MTGDKTSMWTANLGSRASSSRCTNDARPRKAFTSTNLRDQHVTTGAVTSTNNKAIGYRIRRSTVNDQDHLPTNGARPCR